MVPLARLSPLRLQHEQSNAEHDSAELLEARERAPAGTFPLLHRNALAGGETVEMDLVAGGNQPPLKFSGRVRNLLREVRRLPVLITIMTDLDLMPSQFPTNADALNDRRAR